MRILKKIFKVLVSVVIYSVYGIIGLTLGRLAGMVFTYYPLTYFDILFVVIIAGIGVYAAVKK